MADPIKLITEKEPDLDLIYDFDSMPTERKKAFIENIFSGERLVVDMLFNGPIADFFMNMFERIHREKRDDITNGLKGKMTFDEFKKYFASFF